MSRIIASSLLAACMLLGGSLIYPYQVTAAEKPLLTVAIKKARTIAFLPFTVEL